MIKRITRSRLRSSEQGAALTEFALVTPVLLLMVMGIFDMAHTQYTSALMNGAMQQAGRSLTLETAGSQQSAIDAAVVAQVENVVPDTATITLETLSHFDFEDIGEAEEIVNDNGNNVCDPGENFIDANGNGQWDSNRGEEGIGGARDAVLYTVNVSYPRLFPMAYLAGLPENVEISASTVLRNQPFDVQDRTTTTGECS